MSLLILGLVLFLGVHSVRIFADGWRSRVIAARGQSVWKGLYAALALAGFVLIVWGYGAARQQPVVLWATPGWTRHAAALLSLVAFLLLVAAYVPGNAIKAMVKHPMVLAVKVWAIAHLIANNTLADVVLFGAFLLWAVLDFRSARQRDRAAGTVYPPGRVVPTVIAVVIGLVAYAGFAFWAHRAWIGVSPFVRGGA
ncbi:MAG: NnrU family protein [Rubrivivax sp.]|nr:NnrU family protein [Rubrivivax sp.]